MENLFRKIYVEVERARLTHRLAKIKEEEGDTAGAASVMLELQVYIIFINANKNFVIKVDCVELKSVILFIDILYSNMCGVCKLY